MKKSRSKINYQNKKRRIHQDIRKRQVAEESIQHKFPCGLHWEFYNYDMHF